MAGQQRKFLSLGPLKHLFHYYQNTSFSKTKQEVKAQTVNHTHRRELY